MSRSLLAATRMTACQRAQSSRPSPKLSPSPSPPQRHRFPQAFPRHPPAIPSRKQPLPARAHELRRLEHQLRAPLQHLQLPSLRRVTALGAHLLLVQLAHRARPPSPRLSSQTLGFSRAIFGWARPLPSFDGSLPPRLTPTRALAHDCESRKLTATPRAVGAPQHDDAALGRA